MSRESTRGGNVRNSGGLRDEGEEPGQNWMKNVELQVRGERKDKIEMEEGEKKLPKMCGGGGGQAGN